MNLSVLPTITLGAKLRRMRTAQRWSLDELAAHVASSKSHLSALETGRASEPSVGLLQRLATFHGVSMEYLLSPAMTHPDSESDHLFITLYRTQSPPVRAQLRDHLQQLLAATVPVRGVGNKSPNDSFEVSDPKGVRGAGPSGPVRAVLPVRSVPRAVPSGKDPV